MGKIAKGNIFYLDIMQKCHLSKIKLESFTNSGGCVPNCWDNKDCSINQICMKGRCLDSCSRKNKCSKMGQSCLKISPANSRDICFEHEHCATGQICIKGKCQVRCDKMTNGTCPKGQQCQKRKLNKPMKIKMQLQKASYPRVRCSAIGVK